MNELDLIGDFRSAIPHSDPAARAAARARLDARIGGRASWWRRRTVVLAAAALLAVVAVGTAVAFGDDLVDLVRGKPAPSTFQGPHPAPFADFSAEQVDGMKNIPEKAREQFLQFTVPSDAWRGVFAFRTSYGPVALYTGTARNGSLCWTYVFISEDATRPIKGHNFTSSGCGPKSWHMGDRGARPPHPRLGAVYAELNSWVPGDERASDPGLGKHVPRIFFGKAALGVDHVEVRLRDGSSRRLKVWDTLFAGELPWGVVPVEARAYDRDGRLLAMVPCGTNGGYGGVMPNGGSLYVVAYACQPGQR
jgi:hypothetical protein